MRSLRLSISLLCCILCVLLVNNCDANENNVLKYSERGPTLKFFYCYSCGYRKVFEEYATILRDKYPEIKIEGENYNPSGLNMLIAKLLGILKIVLIVSVFCGINIPLGEPYVRWMNWCIENRLYSCLMIFFLCNAIESQLISSGAFEISFNDVPVWSKLETGRIPQPAELFQIIENHMRMMMSEIDIKGFNFNN